MKKNLRILVIEDVASDVELMEHALSKGGIHARTKRVENRTDFLNELQETPPDVILSDHGLPSFDGFTALALARERCPEVPFIFVTGTLGEEMAIETFESGASDYVLKNRLNTHLVPAVERALREAGERGRRQQAEKELRESNARKTALLDAALDAIVSMDHEGKILEWNLAAEKMFSLTREQAMHRDLADLIIPPTLRESHRRGLAHLLQTGEGRFIGRRMELVALRQDGVVFPVEVAITRIAGIEPPMFTSFIRDITEQKEAEAALKQSEARKAAILDNALDAIISIDAHGTVREWNPAAETIFGYRRSEAVGRDMDSLIVPVSLLDVYREGLAHYLVHGAGSLVGRPIELLARRANGTEFPADLIVTRVEADELMFTCFIRDITERKRATEELRRSEERYRMLVESVEDYAILLLDPDGRVATWNTGAEQQTGYQALEIIGQPTARFFTSADIATGRPARALQIALADGQYREECWNLRKDGSRYRVSLLITALRNEAGRLYGYSQISRDVTERKQAEDETRRLNAELEQRVIERTTQLEMASQELEAFSYSISHDLRTPLRHISGFVDLLQSRTVETLRESERDILQTIADAAKQMGRLIDDLLAFSRTGRVEMRLHQISLPALVQEVVHELRHEMAGREVAWQIGTLPEVWGDPALLRQALQHLLSNAVKFTRPRTHTRIEMGSLATAGETLCYIRDNGVGFDMKHATRLFGVFQRLHRSTEFEGTGIGLANTRRIISRHGGRIWAEGRPDEGATFFFTLPASADEYYARHQMHPAGR